MVESGLVIVIDETVIVTSVARTGGVAGATTALRPLAAGVTTIEDALGAQVGTEAV